MSDSNRQISRRSVIGGGALLTMGLLASCGSDNGQTQSKPDASSSGRSGSSTKSASGTLSVAVYGGPTAKTWNESFGKPFMERYPDVKLTISGAPNPASLLYTQSGNVQFDLVLGTASDVAQLASGPAGRYTPIQSDSLQRAGHVLPKLVSKTTAGLWAAAPVALTYYAVVVDTRQFRASDVTSWADLANSKFRGKYLMNSPAFFATTDLPMFALANGGTSTKLDPGFDLLKSTLPNIKGVETSLADAASQLQSGTIGVAPSFFSQYSQLLDSGLPVSMSIPKEGAYASPLYLIMAPNSKNNENALLFIDSVLEKAQQESVQDPSAYIPVVDDAQVSEKIKSRSGFKSLEGIIEKMTFPDYQYLATNRDANTRKIQDIIAS